MNSLMIVYVLLVFHPISNRIESVAYTPTSQECQTLLKDKVEYLQQWGETLTKVACVRTEFKPLQPAKVLP